MSLADFFQFFVFAALFGMPLVLVQQTSRMEGASTRDVALWLDLGFKSRRAHQGLGIRVSIRLVLNRIFWGNLDNLAKVHDGESVADMLHNPEIVRDVQICEFIFLF